MCDIRLMYVSYLDDSPLFEFDHKDIDNNAIIY